MNQKTCSSGTTGSGKGTNVQRSEKLVGDAIDQGAGDDSKEDTSEDSNDPLLLVSELGDSCKGKFRVHFDER